MTISFRCEQDALGRDCLVLGGSLDIATQSVVIAAGETVLAHGPKQLVLDLRDVSFMDSTGFRALVELNRSAQAAGAQVVLKAPSRRVVRLLEVIGLIDYWQIEPVQCDDRRVHGYTRP